MTILNDIRLIATRNSGSTAIRRLKVLTLSQPTPMMAFVFEPVVCLVLQGAKRTLIGDQTFDYGPVECMVVTAEVTALSQVYKASADAPFISLNLSLDPVVISSVLAEMIAVPALSNAVGFTAGVTSSELLDVWRRLAGLLERRSEIPVMFPLLERELIFRLLLSPYGRVLRQIGGYGTLLESVRRSMAWIREHYKQALSVGCMAEVAGMSVSVFHKRFKEVTALSPLQYQKHIRLHEARRMMMSEGAKAAQVGFSVGYESASQFSREYKRLFGNSPGVDGDALQHVLRDDYA